MSLNLLRIHLRGLEIDAKCGECGVIDLVVRAHNQQRGAIGRIAQYIARALYRVGDALHASEYDRVGLRVVEFVMPHDLMHDLHANRRQHQIILRHPNFTNGDAHYDTAAVNESVKDHQQQFASHFFVEDRGDISTFHTHQKLPENTIYWPDDATAPAGEISSLPLRAPYARRASKP